MATTARTFPLDRSATHGFRAGMRAEVPPASCATPSEETVRFELFRRAVCERDEAAWEELAHLYQRLLIAWAQRHPAAHRSEGAEVWAQRALARFFAAVSPASFGGFPSLAAVLRYLKLCVHSEIVDEARRRAAARVEPLGEDREDGAAAPGAAESVEGDLATWELWRAIMDEVRDEAERLVATATLANQHAPREVAARYPDHFPTVADVYRVKRNLLDRLRRNPNVRRFLEE